MEYLFSKPQTSKKPLDKTVRLIQGSGYLAVRKQASFQRAL